eukprot:1733937-Pleurochrysis_carterae.AAC.1
MLVTRSQSGGGVATTGVRAVPQKTPRFRSPFDMLHYESAKNSAPEQAEYCIISQSGASRRRC